VVRVTRGGAGSVSRSENRPHAGGRAAYRASLRASRIGRAASQYDDFLGETDVRRRFSDFFVHAQQGVASDPGNADPNVPGYLGGGTLHLHGDLIRSTLLRTEEGGQAVAVSGGPSAVVSYTAFGEPVWADPNGVAQVGFPPTGFGTRYQYAGGWGYETGLPSGDGGFRGGLAAGSPSRFVWDTTAAGPGQLGRGPGASQGLGSPEGGWVEFAAGSGRPDEFQPPDDVLGLAGVHAALPPLRLLHVGWRWYDPSLGRFVQRDPVGLAGGLNVYVYLRANPVCVVDPLGLLPGEQWVVDWLSRHPRLAEGFINITGGRSSWLDDPKKADQAVIIAGGIGILAAGGGLVCIYMGWDCVILGAMKAGQLIKPRPIPVRPPSPPVRPAPPSWDWWDDWMNDPQFWL